MLDGFVKTKTSKQVLPFEMDNSIMYCCWGDFQPTNKIAAFDFDGTLANVKGSYSYPKDGDDFVLYHPSVLHVLEQLHKKGYTIIVFSNQGKIAEPSNHKRRDTFQGRVRHLHQKLTLHNNQIPVLVLAATGEDFCRKPRPGMWYWLHSKYNLDLQLHPDSFFVGDASGRHKGWMGKRTQDHSDFDRKYALNLNLPFYVPEQVFNDQVLQRFDQESHREWFVQVDELPPVDFDPKEYLGSGQDLSHLYQYDMIILVGSPASGKSTFCQKLPHVRVNQDQLKRKEKCIQYCREQLSQGKKVIIDNTNPTEKSRQEYLQLLGEGQTGIVVWIKTPMDVCFHNNKVRRHWKMAKKLVSKMREITDSDSVHVPDVALYTYWKRLEEPKECHEVQFSANFENEDDRWLWSLHF